MLFRSKNAYFSHNKPESSLGWLPLAPLVWEYAFFWAQFWLRNLYRVPRIILRILRKKIFSRKLWLQRKTEGR